MRRTHAHRSQLRRSLRALAGIALGAALHPAAALYSAAALYPAAALLPHAANATMRVPAALPEAPAFSESVREALEAELTARGEDYAPRTRNLAPDGSPLFSNRLLLEASPYLLQHAHNPVNWYPWGDQAFEAARRLGRPVLVSIGYSTCHWCHVMEEESFDRVAVARLLNAHFVAIKVDREQRPDVDAIYMSALHAMGQRGGWPLNVWLTPDRKPFYAGTYFPPADRNGRPGFTTILEEIRDRYTPDRALIEQSGEMLTAALKAQLEGHVASESRVVGEMVLARAVAQFEQRADRSWGGVQGQTKFPSSLPIRLLLREYRRTKDEALLELATLTLEKIAAGGIHDQIGGGFHRYSTEPRWLIPHFEKMLYDNALLAVTYLEAWQLTDRPDFLAITRSTLDYVLREMTDPSGGFYSATDADSLAPSGESEEGYFFTWTPSEIEAALDDSLARVAIVRYGVTQAGQYEGRNILHTWRSDAEVAQILGISEITLAAQLAKVNAKLYVARARRTPPARDEKIIAAWNGLMISAFARAGFALEEPRYLHAAARAARFVLDEMRTDGRLRRISLAGRADGPAFLEDFGFVIAALLDLYEADADPFWLREAIAMQRVVDTHYLDAEGGGYFKTAADGPKLLAREKPSRDGALPSGNSVMAANLLRLGALLAGRTHRARLDHLYGAMYPILEESPTALPELLAVASERTNGVREVVLVAPEEGGDIVPMLEPLRVDFVPNRVLVVVREGEGQSELAKILPLVEGRHAIRGKVTAYVCEDHVCQLPTSDPKVLREQLHAARKP